MVYSVHSLSTWYTHSLIFLPSRLGTAATFTALAPTNCGRNLSFSLDIGDCFILDNPLGEFDLMISLVLYNFIWFYFDIYVIYIILGSYVDDLILIWTLDIPKGICAILWI